VGHEVSSEKRANWKRKYRKILNAVVLIAKPEELSDSSEDLQLFRFVGGNLAG